MVEIQTYLQLSVESQVKSWTWITLMFGLGCVLKGQNSSVESCPWHLRTWLLLSIEILCVMLPSEEVDIDLQFTDFMLVITFTCSRVHRLHWMSRLVARFYEYMRFYLLEFWYWRVMMV
ncbi:hypothetical protein Mapa_006173 [Marchantia paleacea]|nr:hypothetical protein Mapa_006173 [Marchantia paleacea]